MVIVEWVPIVPSERPFGQKIIGFLFRTLRDKNGHLSAERFINIKDGKNFMKVSQKQDRSFLKKKVIPQAEV